MNNILLNDEKSISNEDYEERKVLIYELEKMPIEMFAKMRHFQPQIGCLNACRICSKFAKANISGWNEARIRNVIAAIKCVASKYRKCKPYIVWDRKEHRTGVIFSYLDNDIGNYSYLYEFTPLYNLCKQLHCCLISSFKDFIKVFDFMPVSMFCRKVA